MTSSSSSSKHKQKQHVGSKSMENEEIVRYMSNLPSYLERGKPVQDRALSFGVLDWGRLEQWQYHHHHYQPSIITNNSYSTNRSSLHSQLNVSSEDNSSKHATNRSRTKQKSSKKNDLCSQNLVESKPSSSSFSKGKMKIQDELVNQNGNFQDFSKIKAKVKIDSRNEDGNLQDSSKTKEKLKLDSRNENQDSSKTKEKLNLDSGNENGNLQDSSKTKAKVKLDLGNCKEVKVDKSNSKTINNSLSSSSSSTSSSSRKRALFQITVKNGRPFFTFSVDNNNNNILAATVRSLTTKDDTNSWIYTFFTIQEVKKKKNSWLYLYNNSKDNKHNTYLPNVTAQMRVSNPSVSNGSSREFVLSSVDSGVDHDEVEDEVAGIVVRFLTKASEDDNVLDCFSMTVVLPGGHHSVPRKGDPSPLIERWRSGGRCDCGGWDVGCRLRTLGNNVKSGRRLNSSESFELFLQLQGDIINERPFFSLSPIKEGIFSVDYNASLSLLHAFSICISVIECRKSSHYTELRTYVAKQVGDDDVAPVTYASLPPVSPVGRV